MPNAYSDNVGMIQRGGAMFDDSRAKYKAEQEANTPPSAFEQALARVMAGEDPVQVAKEHKAGSAPGLAIAGARNMPQRMAGPTAQAGGLQVAPQAAPTGDMPLGYNPGDAPPEVFADPTAAAAQGAPPSEGELMRGGGLGGAVMSGPSSRGLGGRGSPAPETRRDMESLFKMAPYFRTREQVAARQGVAQLQEEGRDRRLGVQEGGRTERSETKNETTRRGQDMSAASRSAAVAQREADSQRDFEASMARTRAMKEHQDAIRSNTRNPKVKYLLDRQKIALKEAEEAWRHVWDLDRNPAATEEDRAKRRKVAEAAEERARKFGEAADKEDATQVIEVPAQVKSNSNTSSLPPGFRLKK